jgi:hypothetical protein
MRHPSRSSIGAIFRPRIEGNSGTRSAPMDRVDNRLEYLKTLRRQTHASADHNTAIFIAIRRDSSRVTPQK